jgi:hypothetical protein
MAEKCRGPLFIPETALKNSARVEHRWTNEANQFAGEIN